MSALKTQDIPVELREWWKHFQKAAYRHDYYSVFHDWITMTLGQFMAPGQYEAEHAEAMKSYTREEKDALNAMFFEMITVFKQQIELHDYYDMFGTMYETIASNWKKSGLGQFFTPTAVVRVLAELTIADLISTIKASEEKGKRVLDPCCGSGRMLFIAHVRAPGNFQYGVDIDPICAKMTALNMMFHGCVGEVVCGNALWLENDWKFAFAINPILTHHGIPSVMKIEKEVSYMWRQLDSWRKDVEEKKPAQAPVTKKAKGKKQPEPTQDLQPDGSQLILF